MILAPMERVRLIAVSPEIPIWVGALADPVVLVWSYKTLVPVVFVIMPWAAVMTVTVMRAKVPVVAIAI